MVERIDKDFSFYHPTENTKEKLDLVHGMFKALGYNILDLTPPGREQSLCITNLEQALGWADKAVERNEG